MVRHICTKAYRKGFKCQPLRIIVVIVIFTILHIVLVRTFNYKSTLNLSPKRSIDVGLEGQNGLMNDNFTTTTDSEATPTVNFEVVLNHNDDDYTDDYEVNEEEEEKDKQQLDKKRIEQKLPKIDPHNTIPNLGSSTSNAGVISPPKSLYSEASKTNKICTIPSILPVELQKRRDRAKSACTRLRKELPIRWKRKYRGPSTGMLSKLRWDQKHHLLYCHLPKVASTTWAWHMLRAIGMKDEEISAHRNVHILLQERLSPPTTEHFDTGFLRDAFSFLVSRHPFLRLVSAYKNKIIEAEKRRQHYVDLRKSILEKYHKPPNTSATIPSFRDFCEYVADSTENWLSNLDHEPPPDLHWMPMTYVCSPCNLRYDVFSKLETMEEDTNFIAAQCGLSDVIMTGTILNPSNIKDKEEEELDSNGSSMLNSSTEIEYSKDLSKKDASENTHSIKIEEERSKLVKTAEGGDDNTHESDSPSYSEYIKELSSEELERLYRIYRFDFEIFGYSVDDYR